MNCSKCQAPLGPYFKIEHVGPEGTVNESAALCSITCLVAWGYDYARMAGMRMAIGVQQKVNAARGFIDQLKGFVKRS